jgi:PTS system galactitol-specific IIA component
MPINTDKEFILDEDLIKIHIKADSKDDVFEQLGRTLISKGYVTEDYIEALKDREIEFPTGLQTQTIGVAIPHTDAKYVNRTTISVGVLDKSVPFEMMGCDDGIVNAEVIFMLSVNNPDKHISILQKLMGIFQRDEVLANIKNSIDTSSIMKILSQELI